MINLKEQEDIFNKIGEALKKEITAYAIGGTALMLRGIKATTLDVDLVFESEEDREHIMETMRQLAYKDSDYRLIYHEKNTDVPKVLLGEKERFDFFLERVITSTFSVKMKERSSQTHEFGRNLILKAAHPTDIVLMKSATDREKDDADIEVIYRKSSLDWNILLGEVEEQVKLGNERAILDLGYKLGKLHNNKMIIVPQDFSDKLWRLLKKQTNAKKKTKK